MAFHPVKLLVLATLGLFLMPAPGWGDQTDPRLDTLLDSLAHTQDPAESQELEARIWRLWRDPGSPTLDLLMTRAVTALEAEDYSVALVHLTDVVELAPNYAEGWYQRAMVYVLTDRYDQAVLDFKQALTLEPRHYGAWGALGRIYMDIGNNEMALTVFRRALEINPHLSAVAETISRLEKQVEGQGI